MSNQTSKEQAYDYLLAEIRRFADYSDRITFSDWRTVQIRKIADRAELIREDKDIIDEDQKSKEYQRATRQTGLLDQ